MTESSTPTPDPTVLVVDRPPPKGGRSRRSLILVLGLVAGIGLAVGLAVWGTGGGDDGVTGDETGSGTDAVEDAGQLWGNRYVVVSTVERGGVAPAAPPGDDLTVSFATSREVSFTGCNGGSGPAEDGDERVVVRSMMSTMMACGGPDGERLMAYDTWMVGVFDKGVTVAGAVEGPVLVADDGAEVRLRLLGPVPPTPTVEDPDAPVSSDADGTVGSAVPDGPLPDPGGTGTEPADPGPTVPEPLPVEPADPMVPPATSAPAGPVGGAVEPGSSGDPGS